MAKATQAGRLRGPGAAGGADPGTPNTTAAEKAKSAVVAEGAAPAAPEGFSQFDAAHATEEGNTPPVGDGVVEGSVGLRPDNAEPGISLGGFEPYPAEPAAGVYVPVASFVVHLRIASRSPEGFRRCGRRWGPEAVEVSADEFSDEEILRLFAEPELIVLAVTGGTASDDE